MILFKRRYTSSNFFPKLSAISPLTMGLTGHTPMAGGITVENSKKMRRAGLPLRIRLSAHLKKYGFFGRHLMESQVILRFAAIFAQRSGMSFS